MDRLLLLPPPSGGGDGTQLLLAGLSVSPLRARLTLSSGGLLLRQWRRVFNRDGGELLKSKARPVWPAKAAREADLSRLAGAWGSLGRDLAPRAAPEEPAGRRLCHLGFDTGELHALPLSLPAYQLLAPPPHATPRSVRNKLAWHYTRHLLRHLLPQLARVAARTVRWWLPLAVLLLALAVYVLSPWEALSSFDLL